MKIRSIFCHLLFWFLVSILPLESRSQLTVVQGSDIGMTPLEFVQTYLVGTDDFAILNGFVSVVPVSTDLTAYTAFPQMQKWKF